MATKQAMFGRGRFHAVPCREVGKTATSEQAVGGWDRAENPSLGALYGTWGEPDRGA